VATDWLTRRLGLRRGRSLLGIAAKFLAAGGILASLVTRNPLLATLALAFSSFVVDTGLAATWAYFQDTGGPYVGTFLGWANMFGNFGSALSPVLLGFLAGQHGWPFALGACAALFIASGVCWFGVDARIPIVPRAIAAGIEPAE
jgi:MFS family permease